jgi:hypothetical protein
MQISVLFSQMSNHIQLHVIYSLGKANTHSLDYIMLLTQQSYSRNIPGHFWPLHGLKGNTIYSCTISRAAKAHLPLPGAKWKHARETIIQTPHVWNGLI